MPQFAPLPSGPFDIVLADPPWRHPGTNHGPNASVGAADYDIVSLRELKRLPVAFEVKPDAQLYLWTSGPLLRDAIELGEAWGFRYVTLAFVWDKRKTTLGYHTMPQTEQVLLFARGRKLDGRASRNERQLIQAPRGPHSRKPDQVQESIERMYPSARRLELFARRERPGWTAWGNQVAKDAAPREREIDPWDPHDPETGDVLVEDEYEY